MDAEAHILARAALGPATLAQLRAALPPGDLDRRALPTMGEPDPFGEVVAALVSSGRLVDRDGVYALPR